MRETMHLSSGFGSLRLSSFPNLEFSHEKKTMLITALGVFNDTILDYNVMTTPVFKAEIRSPRDFPFFRSIDRVGEQVSE